MIQQPQQPEVKMRVIYITCFSCDKDIKVELKSWQHEKQIICPECSGKQAIIRSPF